MFNRISEDNFRKLQLPRQSSLVNYSSFKELKTDVLFRSFSIKFVADGCEKYHIDGNLFKIQKNEYLLGNNFTGGNLTIGSNTTVKGLCIDIAPSIISEVASGFNRADITESESNLDLYFTTDNYLENKYNAHQNFLGKKLLTISQTLEASNNYQFEFTNEFFYDLAENIIADQYHCVKEMNTINSIKILTRKTLYRKILLGKNFMDSHFNTIKNIDEVAQECSMSEYHFYRLFRQVYKMSPYQYILKMKMNYAAQLLENKTFTISEIALLSGFNDLSVFSKSFKKHFGRSPQHFALAK